jgi:predicted transcriptional regulator
MGRTRRTQVALYLDDDKVAALKRLARQTGHTQQELLRQGVAEILLRYQEAGPRFKGGAKR